MIKMKLSKNELKAMIKECLVEILAEGLGAESGQALMREVKKPSNTVITSANRDRIQPTRSSLRTAAESITYGRDGDKISAHRPPDQTSEAVRTLQSVAPNKIMADIFADSARTLMEQNAADGRGAVTSGDYASRMVDEADPLELFGGEQASRWNSLAFMDGAPPEKS